MGGWGGGLGRGGASTPTLHAAAWWPTRRLRDASTLSSSAQLATTQLTQ